MAKDAIGHDAGLEGMAAGNPCRVIKQLKNKKHLTLICCQWVVLDCCLYT